MQTVWESCYRAVCNDQSFFRADSINAINKMAINYMHKTLINAHFRLTQMATDYSVCAHSCTHAHLKPFINSISSSHCLFSVQSQRFLSLFLLMVEMFQTNFVHILFLQNSFCTMCPSTTIISFFLFGIFVDYIKSEWVCQRARFITSIVRLYNVLM